MAPPSGSDSERLMAQIEAYLRTGEAPPPAPEPPADPAPGRGGEDRRPPGGRLGGWLAGVRRRLGRVRRLGHGGGSIGYLGGAEEAPRWTPGRVALIGALIIGLLLLPRVWKTSPNPGGSSGPDRASPAPAGPGYSFLRVNRNGAPVRWNPCSTITYQLDLAGAPAWAQGDISRAITEISSATGLSFVFDGTTNQFPAADIPPGSASAAPPVVIAWASAAQSLQLGLPATAGVEVAADHLGRVVPVASYDQTTGRMVYITGSIVLGAAADDLPQGFVAGGDGVLLLHELGRLVGLDDVSDPSQVMDAGVLSDGLTGLGTGDRAGLRRLGKASGCVSPPGGGVLQPVL